MSIVYKKLATLGFIGYLPASGTVATLITLPLIWVMANVSCTLQTIVLLVLIAASYKIILKAATYWKESDPRPIVLDEVVGCSIAFYGLPISFVTILIGVSLFRFFDISKILGIKNVEKHPDSIGILADDMVAGLYTNIVLRILFYLYIL